MPRKTRGAAAKKAHDEMFASIVEGAKHALRIARGEADPATYRVHFAPGDVDVKAVRKKTGLSQDAFAGTFGFSTGAVRDWEQRRAVPDQAARAYLYVIGKKPDMVRDTLAPLAPKRNTFGHHVAGKRALRVAIAKEQQSAKTESARQPAGSKRKMLPTHVVAKTSSRSSRPH